MTRRIYQSGDCRVDPVARDLWRGDRLVELPPQVFDCIAYLIERHDRAVGRDELVAAVWGKTEVSDTLLGQTVLRIRRELGDDGKEQRIVRTIPRFGYRWVALVETIVDSEAVPAPAIPLDEGGASTAGAAMKSPPRSARHRSTIGLALGAAAVACAALFLVHRHDDTRATQASGSVDAAITAAVIPSDVDAGSDWSWLRFGVMDVVASHLRASGVPTVPSENVIALLATPASQRSGSLRAAAGFGWMVSPHTSRSGTGWRVHLDADDGAGQQHAVEATAPDAADAARLAADRLLVALGRKPPPGNDDAAPYADLTRRVDAAILADDPAAARQLIGQAPAAAQASAELRLRLAKIDFRGGRLDAARTRLTGLLGEAPADIAPVQRAAVLNGLGAVAIRSDQPVDAERYFTEAVALLVSKTEPAQLGMAYIGRAGAEKEQGRFDEASADYSRARVALKQANDTLALLRVAANEGFLDIEQGRPAQALSQLKSASEGFERWGALNEAIYAYIGQIGCQLALLEPARAMDAADAAAPLAARIDNQDTRDSLTIARARALDANGRLREARAALVGLRDRSAGIDPTTEAVADVPMAQLELDAGHLPLATTLATTAVDALVQRSYAQTRAQAWLIRTRAALRAPDGATTLKQVTDFSAWASQAADARVALFAQLALAQYAWRFGDGREWRAQFDRARTLAEQRAVPAELALVAAAYADALIAEGDLPSAAVEVGRLSRWSDRDFASAVMEARLYAALGRDEARQTALARARSLAGERTLPTEARAVSISSHEASTR